MAISSVTVSQTMEWAKKLSFNRLSAIGNNLEPALTSANMVMQTILGPPFTWWWNNQEVAFTCSTTAASASVTNVAVVSGTMTLTCTNSFSVGSVLLLSGLTAASAFNGLAIVVGAGSTGSSIVATVNLPNYTSAADSGTATNTTTQDYTVAMPTFSHINDASILDVTKTPNKWWELEVKESLAHDSTLARPSFISPHTEDTSGNVTFRVMPAPAANYPVTVHAQLAAPILTSINSTWAPIPDFMQNIYSWGFLALIWAFSDDARFQIANQKFTAGLLARAEGISEEDKNIFLSNWHGLTGQAKMQQGMQARGV